MAEKLNRTLLNEHFRIMWRKKWYESVEVMQVDLDEYMRHYIFERPHQGRGMEGRTPYQVFKNGIVEIKLEEENQVPEAA